MAVTVERLREYLGDPPCSDADLSLYLKSAKSKARGAGIPDFKHNANYDIFILALAGMRYDNKNLSFVGGSNGDAEKKLIDAYTLELRYADEDPEEEEEEEEEPESDGGDSDE